MTRTGITHQYLTDSRIARIIRAPYVPRLQNKVGMRLYSILDET